MVSDKSALVSLLTLIAWRFWPRWWILLLYEMIKSQVTEDEYAHLSFISYIVLNYKLHYFFTFQHTNIDCQYTEAEIA